MKINSLIIVGLATLLQPKGTSRILFLAIKARR